MRTFEAVLRVKLTAAQPDSWLARHLQDPVFRPPQCTYCDRIEILARETERLGAQPLWQGYSKANNYPWPVGKGVSRTPDQVRITGLLGNLFTWLVTQRNPVVVVEFGTAFGVSGMYWLAGLEANGIGELLTFEPNEAWARIAEKNLSAISNRFELTIGTFEANIDHSLRNERRIDLAFIDAIHTSEFLMPQFKLVADRLAPNGMVIFDDIDFSQDMRSCWGRIRLDNRIAASAEVGAEGRGVGIVEFRSV